MESHADRVNNFGLVRLVLAALVIVSHSPEIIDGNRSRELATIVWGTLSFGEIAVDGFFLVSGFLVTQSFIQSSSVWSYLRKRVLRIYPAFIIAFASCLLVVAPLAGGTSPPTTQNALELVLLLSPSTADAFVGMPYPALNGAMWTIAYEFRCYILVAVLGTLGLLRWRWAIAVVSAAFLLATGLGLVPYYQPGRLVVITGDLPSNIRVMGCFLAGVSFYLFRDRIGYDGRVALAALFGLFAALFVSEIAELALVSLGGYALLWFTFRAPAGLSKWLPGDVSYGVYLYAWPVQSLLVHYALLTQPWLLTGATLMITIAFGAASWWLVERPAMRWRSSPATTG